MNIKIHSAGDGVVAQWLVAGDTLHIYLNDDLDDVARQRYIAQAKIENGVAEQQRRLALPLPLPLQHLHSAASQHRAVSAGVGMAAAAGMVAAVILPAVMDDNRNEIHRNRPPVAAPPAPRPDESGTAPSPDPQRTPQRTSHPRPTSTPAVPLLLPSAPAERAVNEASSLPPVDVPPVVVPPSKAPAPSRHRVGTRIDLWPLADVAVRISQHPQIRVRVGAT